MYVKNGTGVLKRVLLSKPQYLKAAPINEIARKWAPELDVEKMLHEHELVVKAYHDAGVETEFLEPDANRPNSVFARDFGGCVRGTSSAASASRCDSRSIRTTSNA